MYKLLHKIHQPEFNWLISNVLILVTGLWIRYQRIISELVWGEEAIYLDISRRLPWSDLLLVKHWLIDHPQLYLLWGKLWTMGGTSPIWLRFPNLVIYLLSGIVVIRLAKQLFKSKFIRLSLVSFYAFFPYFVGLEWQAVPYFLAILFSLISLYYALVIIGEGDKKGQWISLGLALTLFLYTSFEAIYFGVALSIFTLLAYLFRLIPIVKVKSLISALVMAAVLFIPEVVIVMIRMKEFLVLADKFETRGYEVGAFLTRLFLMPPFNLAAYGLAGLVIVWMLWRKLNDMREKAILMFLTIMLIGSGGIIYAISTFFLEVRHPRAFYYLVLLVAMLALKLIEDYSKFNRYLKYGLTVGLLVFATRYYLNVNDNWKMARYAYSTPYPHTLVMREKLTNFLKNKKDEGQNYQLVLGNNLTLGIWYEGVFLYDYYFKCLDLADKSKCDVVSEAILETRGHEAVKGEKGQRLVGVFVSTLTIDYYVNEICPGQESCYIWDYNKIDFSEVK